uniref:Putative ethanolaminephosphotransferase n=1 Tax=Trypanosoma congolense (strain IL3000) TaxID=1068625 RepID=G0UX75_TRYCI|nr:putative ethanolaminephosphotransferase [Trypanosoma congolense IL3000]
MCTAHRASGAHNSFNIGVGLREPRCVSLDPRVHEHIPPHYLSNLAKYKYSGSDSGLVSRYIMQPYWNFIVSLVPMTIAPNAITITGFLMCLSSSLVVMFFYYFQNAEYPSWVWLYAAFCLFCYQTLDAIDGKQARRTNSVSPVGELFDHGCDAILTPFVQLKVCCALNTSPRVTFVYMVISSCVLFAAIWEQFVTGTLDLGYVNGPTDGILLACGIFIVTSFLSTSVWDTPIVGPYNVTLPSLISGGGGAGVGEETYQICTIRSVLFAMYIVSGVVTILNSVSHVIMRPSVQSRGASIIVALPTAVLLALHVWLYAAYFPIHVKYPFALELSFAFLVSYTVTRMTVARLCAMPYSLFNAFYVVTFIFTAGSLAMKMYFPFEEEKYLLSSLGSATVALAALGMWQYFHMIFSVVTQMAYFLRISVFSITPHHDVSSKRD